jgi:hypothetical protein
VRWYRKVQFQVARSTAARTKQDNGNKERAEVKFINYDLTIEDKNAFKTWAHEHSGQEAFDLIMQVTESGYNLSTKFSEYDGCHAAFITPTKQHPEYEGYILSGRGSTPFGAIMGALFRHLVLFAETWPIRTDTKRSMDDDF